MKDTRAQESGRTMTEMLAVIGIIGVLSVGGMTLGGYVIGGIKANRVVSGLQERILLAQKRRIVGQSLSFRKRRIEESIMGLYPVEYKTGETDEENSIYYGKKITVSEIPQQVCEGLKKDASLQATLDEVGGIISFNDGGEDGACQEEDNTFFVLFGGRSEGKCHGVKNGCMICDEASGEWEIDETMDGEPIDICHICSNGNIVAKEKGKVVPCGKDCCTLFETCDAEEGCVTRCPANSSVDYVAGNQIGNSECYCNAGYRVDAFQTGCISDCGENGYYNGDKCQCLNGYRGPDCRREPYNGSDSGVCENGNVYLSYMDDPCGTDTPDDMECTKNSDCDNGYFCELKSASSRAFPDEGTCTPLTDGTQSAKGGTVYEQGRFLIGPVLSWWSAENWCRAHNKNLADLKGNMGLTGTVKDCEKTSCKGISWTNLTTALGSKWFWTGNNRDESVAYGIHPSYNQIDGGYHSAEWTALCTN